MITQRAAKGVSLVFRLTRDFLSLTRSADRRHFAGIIDFSYQHYALGDVLTSQMNMACLAVERGCSGIDLYVIVYPWAPSAPSQGFITPANYPVHLDNLFPAFLCSPMVRSVRIIRDPLAAGLQTLSVLASRVPVWPSPWDHLRRRMTYPIAHDIINRFHARHGYVPLLSAPRGYARWAREFIERHYPDRFLVCVNPRQSRLTSVAATTYRDASLAEWYEFFRVVERRYPETHFFMLGGYGEWEHKLLAHENVTIPRTLGLTLAHELALLEAAHLFMGTSSGFATMATFTRVPYVITNMEHVFAPHAGIAVGSERYPFATEHQHLVWAPENARLLLEQFERLYGALRGPARAPAVPAGSPRYEAVSGLTSDPARNPAQRQRRRPMAFYIDVVGSDRRPEALMDPALLTRIMEKAIREAEVTEVALLDRNDPLLHPQLPDLIRAVKAFQSRCTLGSPLTVLEGADEILSSGLDSFRISVSGLTAGSGGSGRGVDAERVKANMAMLAAAWRRAGSATDIEVRFHRYRGSVGAELEMRRLAERLGFRFTATWGRLMPLEKILTCLDPGEADASLTAEDYGVLERLPLPLDEVGELASRHPVSDCPLQEDYMTLDAQGNVYLCHAVSDTGGNLVGSFLEFTTEDLQRLKQTRRLCGVCMKKGLPLYLENRLPGIEEVGRKYYPL